MTIRSLIAGVSAAAITLAAGSSALSQAAAPAAAPALTHGPALPNVCVVDIQGASANSTVGKYVFTRLKQLQDQATAELQGEATSLQNDARALDTARATLDQNTLEQRAAALQVRDNALQRKGQLRQRELEATDEKASNRIGAEMQPLITQIYQQKGCSMLIRREALLTMNPAMDITPALITALNAKITQFAFDRERLDVAAPPAAAAAAGPPPIIQTPAASRPAAAPAKK
jgi:outer membrane protein